MNHLIKMRYMALELFPNSLGAEVDKELYDELKKFNRSIQIFNRGTNYTNLYTRKIWCFLKN